MYKIFSMVLAVLLLFACFAEMGLGKDKNNQIDTIKIGKQVWMKKNLDVERYRNGDTIRHCKNFKELLVASENNEGAWCYFDFNPKYGKIYGKLYNWYAVFDTRGLAPVGWHVATDDEWKELEIYLGMSPEVIDYEGYSGPDIGSKLASHSNWNNGELKNNKKLGRSGFSALPCGSNPKFSSQEDRLGDYACWWTATEISASEAIYRSLFFNNSGIYQNSYSKAFAFSIRCLSGEGQDFKKSENVCTDGIIKIGNQEWDCKNLDVFHYLNGDPIHNANTEEEWIEAGKKGLGAWCYYDNNPDNGNIYGKLYNWYAINDPRGLVPKGWKIPSFKESGELETFLREPAGAKLAGSANLWKLGSLKQRADFGYSGFNALPGGFRSDDGIFRKIGEMGTWWRTNDKNDIVASNCIVYNSVLPGSLQCNDRSGLSIRCIRESDPIDTVKIGNQVWMKKNLDVNHYRNGDSIPQVTDPKEWENLTTGAWCYFNNDSANSEIYGKLYNWYAVNDPRGLAPEGWHIPSDNEWKTLEINLGMTQRQADEWHERGSTQGSKLAGGGFWYCGNFRNYRNFNISGFAALPCGSRQSNGFFYKDRGDEAFWWSATEYSSSEAVYRGLYCGTTKVNRNYTNKRYGFSVRCVRD